MPIDLIKFMNREAFKKITDELVQFGEDKDEMKFWLSIFDDLDPDIREKLILNLEKELKDLEAIKK